MADSRLSFGTSVNSTGRMIWKSTWSSITAYNVNDLVAWTGGVYIALQASSNILPSNTLFWDLVIASGSVTSFNGRTGSIIAVSSDLSDHDAALGAPLLDASGFLKPAEFNEGVDAVVATTYAIVAADRGRIKTFSNASPVAISIAQATGSFATGWFTTLQNVNTGLCTVTATTSLIEGSATVTLKQWESVTLVSAGGQYICLRSKVRASFADITGTAAMAQGGTGVDLSAGGGTTMVLAQNASHVISARNLVAADIPSLAASIITSGALALARGGTAVDLSASGGTTMVLAQDASHVISARNLVAADIPSLASRSETLTNKTVGAGGLAGMTLGVTRFTASGTFTIPAGVTSVRVRAVGGGAGGGTPGTSAVNGTGGSSGGYGEKILTGLTPGNTLTITIGGAGSGVSNGTGGNGGTTTVASGTQTITSIIANGGNGGLVNGQPLTGGAVGSGGDSNFGGQPGSNGFASNVGGNGGGSALGGGGTAGVAAVGNAAVAPGGGGGGAGASAGALAGGAGAAGIVIFEYVT